MIYLIGTGSMAIDYALVLKRMRKEFIAIGRGENSALHFEEKTGIKPITGGLTAFLQQNKISMDDTAIIATGTEVLMEAILQLTEKGIGEILVEKPAAISIAELLENEKNLSEYAKRIFVAYNRRFYASVRIAQQLIEEDGGLLSMHFEFTEWGHRIEPLQKAPGVKENWFFANSTHVIDTAFFIAGMPISFYGYIAGNLSWHYPTIFSGSGISDKNVLFTYSANWESAGRWSIELLTKHRKIILCPLETIKVQQRGTVVVEDYLFDDKIDKDFKPGLWMQVHSFLGNKDNLLSLKEHFYQSREIFSKILNPSN